MPSSETTCWEVIEGAAKGGEEQRREFARRYTPIVRDYLGARWRGSNMAEQIDDAVGVVFVECFRRGGVLDRTDPGRSGGFRAFFYGVVRNVVRRLEDPRTRDRQPVGLTSDLDAQPTTATSMSRVLDRAWAHAVLAEAGARHRRQAEAKGDDAVRRIELLRLRFEEDLPIRAIAVLWNMAAEVVHREYRRARQEFRRCLEAELRFNGESTEDVERQWKELLDLLQ